jgi:hypothetical protein
MNDQNRKNLAYWPSSSSGTYSSRTLPNSQGLPTQKGLLASKDCPLGIIIDVKSEILQKGGINNSSSNQKALPTVSFSSATHCPSSEGIEPSILLPSM